MFRDYQSAQACLKKGCCVPFLTREAQLDDNSPFLHERIDRCVQALVGGSRSHITGLFDHECVQLNGHLHTDPATRLQAQDRVSVRCEANRRYAPVHRPRREHRGFSIVFEDRELIVVHKSAELLTVPTERREPHTLIYRVNEHIRHADRRRGAHLVHRLDRGVSGLLVFGKTQEMAEQLQRQFAQRKPERRYAALVVGRLEPGAGEFRSFLMTGKSLTRYSTRDPEAGELAITHYETEQQLPEATFVSVWLETGRRNQIRVHFAEAGHPVLGDTRYRPDLALPAAWPWKRMALHAATLAFDHPVSGERLCFTSPLPAEMTDFLRHAAGRTPPRPPTSADGDRSSARAERPAQHRKPSRRPRGRRPG